MTAPYPTAGEPRPTPTVLHDWACSHDPCACASPPAVAASTGTSEDVEALAEEVWADEPTEAERDLIRLILASDWLAAHDAATAERVRREGAALVRDDIQARRREFRRLNADQQYLNALDDAYGLAANRAREQAR